jgi:Tfp pilus assembly protein PilN
MRAVNLLPVPRSDKRQDDSESRVRSTTTVGAAAAAVLVLAAIAIGVAFTLGRSAVNDRQAKLDALQAQVARTSAAASVSAASAGQAQAYLSAVTTAASGHTAWDTLLDQLARVMPAGAWLDSLQATGPAAASTTTSTGGTTTTSATTTTTGAAPNGFVVSGYALSQEIVANALNRLALIPALSDVSLQSTQRTLFSGKDAVQFTIGANVVAGGGNG